MKLLACSILFCTLSIQLLAQDTAAVAQNDSAGKNFFSLYHWTETSKGEFEITVPGYDSIRMGTNEFQTFYYTTTDKPDGKLTVRDEKGNKVRECVYKNHLMFDEHWWFPSGAKEFDGIWSETANEFGDQVLEEYKWYYRNKKVRKHGFRTGITTTYYDDGTVESEKTFRDGKANGMYKEYFPNGKLQTQGEFFDGNKRGEWVHYNTDGTVREREH